MVEGFAEFEGDWGANARLAWDTIALEPTRGIPGWIVHVMDHGLLEEVAGYPPGSYRESPEQVYRDFQLAAGCCLCDQWIPTNPLTMSDDGFDSTTARGATTGAEATVVDGTVIDSPEAVVEHMERVVFPRLVASAGEIDPSDDAAVARLIVQEVETQRFLGRDILKGPYGGFQAFPAFLYSTYGYEPYFAAYALYPEVMERCFALQANRAVRRNALSARAIREGGLPPVVRLDHDMTDSRGTLVRPESLDRIWFPYFARAVEPLLDAGIRLLWHCDGNVMAMVPRLIEAGVGGFQGFQYEDGVDYEAICRMTDRDGGPLMIWAGVSVTRTLPFGTAADVRRELRWLVEHGPPVGLFLGGSSSITPSTRRANVKALIEGLAHYRTKGRG